MGDLLKQSFNTVAKAAGKVGSFAVSMGKMVAAVPDDPMAFAKCFGAAAISAMLTSPVDGAQDFGNAILSRPTTSDYFARGNDALLEGWGGVNDKNLQSMRACAAGTISGVILGSTATATAATIATEGAAAPVVAVATGIKIVSAVNGVRMATDLVSDALTLD